MLSDSIDLIGGWNIVGVLSSSIPINSITSIPPQIVESLFYVWYQGIDHVQANSLQPSKGLLGKSEASRKIIILSTQQKIVFVFVFPSKL
jgi:hypothetical protein